MAFSREAFLAGLRDVAPMMLGVAPFGTITGVAAVGVGLSPGEAIGMSALVFAGASQLAGIALLGQGASFAVIVVTVFMVNLRHTMYSASLAPWLRDLRTGTRLALAYLMTDQAYAFSVLRYRREPDDFPRRDYYLGVALPLWILWMSVTAVGALAGAKVPPGWQLDFAIPLTFLALLAPAVRDRPAAVAAGVGAALALLLRGMPYNAGLIVASVAGIAAGTWAEGRRTPQRLPAESEEAP
jgi:4-azaleucine resistance transporter AzlC